MVSRIPHDVSYKTFFRCPDMVRALLLDFVPARWVRSASGMRRG